VWINRVKRTKLLIERYGGLHLSEYKGWDIICEGFNDSLDFQYLVSRIEEFIIQDFNRQADKVAGIAKVQASLEVPWLFLASTLMSLCEFCKIKLADWKKYGKAKIGEKVYDLDLIMCDKPTNRMHRRLVDTLQKSKHILKKMI
jgi:hypothetical protein